MTNTFDETVNTIKNYYIKNNIKFYHVKTVSGIKKLLKDIV